MDGRRMVRCRVGPRLLKLHARHGARNSGSCPASQERAPRRTPASAWLDPLPPPSMKSGFSRLHRPLGRQPPWQAGGEDANGSGPLSTSSQERLSVVQGQPPCPSGDATEGPRAEAPGPLRLLRPQGQPAPRLGLSVPCCLRVVALATTPLATRTPSDGDATVAAAVSAAVPVSPPVSRSEYRASKSRMREFRTSGSVGAPGRQRPGATRPPSSTPGP
jgi:hypothetical protein